MEIEEVVRAMNEEASRTIMNIIEEKTQPRRKKIVTKRKDEYEGDPELDRYVENYGSPDSD